VTTTPSLEAKVFRHHRDCFRPQLVQVEQFIVDRQLVDAQMARQQRQRAELLELQVDGGPLDVDRVTLLARRRGRRALRLQADDRRAVVLAELGEQPQHTVPEQVAHVHEGHARQLGKSPVRGHLRPLTALRECRRDGALDTKYIVTYRE
jgi:hypothetical protein